MLKFTWLRKIRKINGIEFTQRPALAQEVLKPQVTVGWENIIVKYRCIRALLIHLSLSARECPPLPSPCPVPWGVALLGQGKLQAHLPLPTLI